MYFKSTNIFPNESSLFSMKMDINKRGRCVTISGSIDLIKFLYDLKDTFALYVDFL